MYHPNIPLLLTLFRLLVAPLIIPTLILSAQSASLVYHLCVAGIIFLCALTDYFDGYLARRWNQETTLGKLLDPLADKVFLLALVLSLLVIQKVPLYWAIFILSRELLVTGMREIALTYGFSISVSSLGKVKTMLQIITLLTIIAIPTTYSVDPVISGIIYTLLFASLAATLISGLNYFSFFYNNYQKL